MVGDSGTNRNLWIITGIASVPFAILAINDMSLVKTPHIFYLFAVAVIFNGFLVPFILFKEEPNWLKKTLALGINMVIAVFWIEFTGGIKSIFYPNLFLLPIFAATIYCGMLDALLTAFFGSALTLFFRYNQFGSIKQVFSDTAVLVNIIFFFLIAAIVGYIVRVLREQQVSTNKITSELETAYHQLTSSHEQLQGYTDIIEKMNKEMEQLAITDELTMLYNNRYFQIALDKELKQDKNGNISLLMIDVDHFKQFNESYGHLTGNQLLSEMARIIRENVRDTDLVFRYGGEEFAVIFPQLKPQQVIDYAEKIRKIIQNTTIKTATGKHVSVTVSQGISYYPGDSRNKSELISHADLALAKAKQEGRNQVRIYNE
ncbi:GGDEF domain-containing protein [Phosphitispora sp. TUW77]|uniref:GGDEF domain-containing protein n=1 Tax=Phosphitispora sp. TUW77 TaxID=3152361 RepID=UPI003AB5CB48